MGFDPSVLPEHDREVYMKKLEQMHSGPCSSPRAETCPCVHVCPLHGRCCDCVRHHLEGRVRDGGEARDTEWLPECLKRAQHGVSS